MFERVIWPSLHALLTGARWAIHEVRGKTRIFQSVQVSAVFSGFLLLFTSLWAQQNSDASLPAYVSRTWTIDDSLPHNTVNRLLQDEQGYLWAASVGGLVRFDGLEFKNLIPDKARQEANYNIRDLVEYAPGSLALLPATGGVAIFHDNKFSIHPASTAFAGKQLLALFVEPGGALWVATGARELLRWQDGRVTTFGPADGLPAQVTRFSFAIDGKHELWIAGGNFLGRYRAGRLERFPESVGTDIIIVPSRSGGIWVSTAERLFQVENDRLTAVPTTPAWSTVAQEVVQQLFEDRQKNLWIATQRKGLFLDQNGDITRMPVAADSVTSIIQDREDNIWVATDGAGICRLRPKTYVTLGEETGLTDGISTSICEDSSGALWLANRNGGLARYRAGRLEYFGRENGASLPYVNAVCPDRRGNIWVGASDGIYTIASSAPTHLQKIGAAVNDVRVLYCSTQGDIWVGYGWTGLGYFHEGVFHDFSPMEGLPQKQIRAIAEDTSGIIWIATDDRCLYQLKDGKIVERFSKGQVPGGVLHTIFFDKRGSLWLATSDGLILFRGNRFSRLGTSQGLTDEIVFQILEDDYGRLWCAGRRGFSAIALDELYAVADGRRERVDAITIGKAEGLSKSLALSGFMPLASKARNGWLWFTTQGGVVGVDAAASFPTQMTLPVYIDEFLVDKVPLNTAVPLPLAAGDHELEFRFTALNYSAPEKVRMRHQLVGFDTDWVETGPDRLASYRHLPPGTYQMRVTAATEGGAWSEAGASLTFSISTAWWQSGWFRVIAGLGLAAAFVLLGRYWSHRRLQSRLRQLEREQQLERERTRIARDLHDDIGASVTQIGLIADRLKRGAEDSTLKIELSQLASQTRRLSGELEGVVWTVSPKNDSWDRLASFIRQFALNFFSDTSIICNVEGVETAPAKQVAPEIQHHVFAIVKEALNNILKHARAKRVRIVMSFACNRLNLLISDDGIGFDPLAKEHSERNGLTNQRARAQEIGGMLDTVSLPGSGTEIKLSVALDTKLQSNASLIH